MPSLTASGGHFVEGRNRRGGQMVLRERIRRPTLRWHQVARGRETLVDSCMKYIPAAAQSTVRAGVWK